MTLCIDPQNPLITNNRLHQIKQTAPHTTTYHTFILDYNLNKLAGLAVTAISR
jgi:hypothetical protein